MKRNFSKHAAFLLFGIFSSLFFFACSSPEPNRQYKAENTEDCKTLKFECREGETSFSDSTGCGCEKKENLDGKVGANVLLSSPFPSSGACSQEEAFVCGISSKGEKISFQNECLAKQAGVTIYTDGKCNGSGVCPLEYIPVCGARGEDLETYSNDCLAKIAGAEIKYAHACEDISKDCPSDESPVCGKVFPICANEGICKKEIGNVYRKTFQNDCFAKKEEAFDIVPGICSKQQE